LGIFKAIQEIWFRRREKVLRFSGMRDLGEGGLYLWIDGFN
jgi:hypothetical protein